MEKLSSLEKECIKNIFYRLLPSMNKLSQETIFKQLFGITVNDLGVEKSYEIFTNLFIDGEFKIVAKDIKNFIIFSCDKKSKSMEIILNIYNNQMEEI